MLVTVSFANYIRDFVLIIFVILPFLVCIHTICDMEKFTRDQGSSYGTIVGRLIGH